MKRTKVPVSQFRMLSCYKDLQEYSFIITTNMYLSSITTILLIFLKIKEQRYNFYKLLSNIKSQV